MSFKKRLSKSIALSLIGIIISTPIFNSVSAMEIYKESKVVESYFEDIENYPDLELTEEEIKEINNYLNSAKNGEIVENQYRAIPLVLLGWAGGFFIPGVGTAIINAAGHVIVGGITVSAGSYVGKKIKNHIYQSKKKDAEKAAKEISSRLKKKNGYVDLDKFTEKVKGQKSTWKDPKTGWVKQKDTTNHRGYDGTVKEWKIKKNPYDKGRVASVNSKGKVIDK